MVAKPVSVEKAQKKLEQVVQDFDWLGHFLGKGTDSFIRTYMVLHAQLREGDRLEIEIMKREHSCSHTDTAYPDFLIVHYKKDGSKEVVHTRESHGYGSSRVDNLLYDD